MMISCPRLKDSCLNLKKIKNKKQVFKKTEFSPLIIAQSLTTSGML